MGRNAVCIRQTMSTTNLYIYTLRGGSQTGMGSKSPDESQGDQSTMSTVLCRIDSSSGTKAGLQCLCLQVRRMADRGGGQESTTAKQKRKKSQDSSSSARCPPPQRLRPIIATHTYAAPDLSLRHHANAQTRYLPMEGPCHGQIYLPTLKNGMRMGIRKMGETQPHLPTKP